MDQQVKELIATIRKEGIETAEAQAAEIVKKAEARAAEIVKKAESEAAAIVEEAKAVAERFRRTSEQAVAQAGRDLILRLQRSITAVFDEFLKNGLRTSMTPGMLEETILLIVKGWTEKRATDLEVLLSPSDLEALRKSAVAGLADYMKKGLVLKPVPRIEAGFRIGEKDGSVYYDFTSDGIAAILAEFLNPRLAALILEAAQKGN